MCVCPGTNQPISTNYRRIYNTGSFRDSQGKTSCLNTNISELLNNYAGYEVTEVSSKIIKRT